MQGGITIRLRVLCHLRDTVDLLIVGPQICEEKLSNVVLVAQDEPPSTSGERRTWAGKAAIKHCLRIQALSVCCAVWKLSELAFCTLLYYQEVCES